MNNNKVKTISCIVGMLIIIQISRICIKQIIFTFIERTDYSIRNTKDSLSQFAFKQTIFKAGTDVIYGR